jgi:hypothetical protein
MRCLFEKAMAIIAQETSGRKVKSRIRKKVVNVEEEEFEGYEISSTGVRLRNPPKNPN